MVEEMENQTTVRNFRGVGEYLDMGTFLDGGLMQQVQFDLESLQ